MGYWNSKVVPKFKKLFEKNSAKKAAAAEACKTFDESKETINKEVEEKKTALQPKVVETYEATSAEVKALVRDPKEAGLKKNSAAVVKYLEELVKIEFPGSTAVKDASSTYGANYVARPITFLFEKVCVFLPEEVKTREIVVEEPTKTEEPAKTEEPVKTEETSGEKEKDIVEEIKKDETATCDIVQSVRLLCGVRFVMAQSSFLKGKAPLVRTETVKISNSVMAQRIQQFSLTLIGRLMNPSIQRMESLISTLPKIWKLEDKVVGADLGQGTFQFNFAEEADLQGVLQNGPYHFDSWMISLVK
ncbi:PREDICTED: plasma membrane-associated cation-binding protein 1 [Camelina sativa]|uniref:Plasma membrane-associated cation-binding protein 1 n=1 Tax=Camelina sativa TaxID=90675 RepID=A0ABM0URY3_CAMSA|nr:PREDICTED: plasma membrane-associated cation-binding protein 1 [Camelina sativa]